jgi:putative inorganic carbon (hco3(-)) transporter
MSTATFELPRRSGHLPAAALAAMLGVVAVSAVAIAYSPELAFAAALLLAFVVVSVVLPDIATLAVIGLLFMNVPSVAINHHGMPMMMGVVIPLVLALPLLAYVRQGQQILITPAFVAILVLLLVMLLSTLASSHQDVALERVTSFLYEGVILYFLVSNVVRKPEVLRAALWVVLLSGAALALVTAFQEVTQNYYRPFGGFGLVDPSFYLGRSEIPRASGPLGDPNYYGQILLISAAIGLIFIWRERTRALRILAFLATAVITYAIVQTDSRGTGLALGLLVVIMGYLRYFRASQIGTIVLCIGVLLVAMPEYRDRLASVSSVGSATQEAGSDPEADISTSGRAGEMVAAFHVFRDHPTIGVGPAVFPLYYQDYAQRNGLQTHGTEMSGERRGEEATRQAHNMILSIAAELGFPGLIAFCVLMGIVIQRLRRTRIHALAGGRREQADLATALLLAVLAYLITGLFLTLAFERYFWLLLGLAGAVTTLLPAREKPAADSVPHWMPASLMTEATLAASSEWWRRGDRGAPRSSA